MWHEKRCWKRWVKEENCENIGSQLEVKTELPYIEM